MSPVDAIVLVAMTEEAAPFLARATSTSEPVRVGNALQYTLTLAGRPVLLVQSGIGLVNAAGAATAAILAHRSADGPAPVVVSAGTAGGLGKDVKVPDVVVGNDYLNIDADARAFGYAFGQVPQMPASYPVPAALVAAVASNAPADVMVHEGMLVSSDGFVGEPRAAFITSEVPGALATDMESVALAQTSHVHGVPFVSVRGISDLCGPQSEDEFASQADVAAERSAAVVTQSLDALVAAARSVL